MAVFLPADFAPALRPAFVEILQAFYALEYRNALERCGAFYMQLTAAKHQLGAHHDCTVTSFCVIRTLLHSQMGYYTFPDDLPEAEPPHLRPVQGDGLNLSIENVAFRLSSACFTPDNSIKATCASLGWTTQQHDTMIRENVEFFARYVTHRAPHLGARRGISDVEVGTRGTCLHETRATHKRS